MKNKLTLSAVILIYCISISKLSAQSWTIGGNALGVGSNDFGSTDNKSIDFITNNMIRMSLTNIGKLGLGTSAPVGLLHISQNGNPMKPQLQLTETESDYVRLKFNNSTASGYSWMLSSLCNSVINDSSKFKLIYTNTTGSKEYLVALGNGNVGIGTSNPTARLYVNGSLSSLEPAIYARTNYFVYGLPSTAIQGVSDGSTGSKHGIHGIASGSGDANIGVYGQTYGDAQLNIGVYGAAPGSAPINYAGYFYGDAYVGADLMVGTLVPATGYRLSVAGKVICEELKVQLESLWPDYVFDDSYDLMSIYELKDYILQNKHLPLIAPAAEINENGIEVGEMQKQTVEQLENAMLYIIDLQKQIDNLKAQVELLK